MSRALRLLAVTTVVVALASSCLVWRNQWRHTVAVRVADDVAYIDDGDDKHRLDVFAPAGASSGAPLPVVIFVHGGWWRAGDRSYYEPVVGLYGNVGTALADMGVVTVIPSYRLWPQISSYTQQLDDLAAVIAHTKKHIADVGGDPSRIFLAGHSAGGHLVALLGAGPGQLTSRGLSATDIKGVIAISGIYDIAVTAAAADAEEQATFWTPFFGTPAQQAAASPMSSFVSSSMPFLFLVGGADYKSCLREYATVQTLFADNHRARFASTSGNTHEDMVLEVGTVDDDVGLRISAFASVVNVQKR